MARSTARRVVPSLLLALACALGGAASAPAATTTLEPSPAEARTFATTNGGWSSSVDYDGLACIPGVTCPSANPTHQTTGGAGGAGDGFLRNSFGTLLGVLATTTISWTSPAFVAPASTDTATLRFKVRPQIASLLAIGSVNVTATIVDVADATRSTVVGSVPQTAASTTFGELDFDVPTSAVVAGRSYRVRIDTALTTTVSAVTSGTLDLDDVVLSLVDAQPPTGLTATVPATGPTRVTGTVDAAGHDTAVTVDYGLTTTYGTTTAPVQISGGTSGSQPFTVPLSGLIAGATYHYRVTATSSDGTVSTTDATFVAPTPPSDAVPTVTGAGNARTRTVTYARDADVTDAVIEVLDGGGTVIDTIPDTDADGSVTITLPDADGSYGVRVVRSNVTGQSSTSDAVPVLLDRVAPDVSALNPSVTPTTSSLTTRTVTFTRPADAATVSAQVINAAGDPVGAPVTVAGGSGTVTIGPGDGAYRVRLTLTDASGNAATATSDPVTLDTVAPDAGPAPTVTGDGNSRARHVTFTRDPTAATVVVEVLDAGGDVVGTVPVPTGSAADVTLPDADGDYRVRVRQTDAAGNGAASPTTTVSLDRSAPDVSGLALGLTPLLSNDRDRTLTLVRPADAATVTAQVIDANDQPVGSPVTIDGSSGTVTLGSADGSYRVVVTVEDAAGNAATATSPAVTLDASGPDAGPAPVLSGTPDALTATFQRAPDAAEATIEVRDANGALVLSVPVPSGDSATFALPAGIGAYTVRVVQTDALGNASATPSAGVERQAPTTPGDGGGGGGGGAGAGAGGGTGGGGAGGGTGGGGGTGNGGGSGPGTTPTGRPVCAKPVLVLTRVALQGRRVRIAGWTTHATGTQVRISDLGGKRVGTAEVSGSGTFSVTVAAPGTAAKRARVGYRATVGRHRSPAVKLRRVNELRSVAQATTTLTLRGRVGTVRKLGRFTAVAAYGGTGDCPTINKRLTTVGKPRINRRNGVYSLQVRVPSGTGHLLVKTRVTVGGGNYHSAHVVR